MRQVTSGRVGERLVALVIAAALAFNYPLLYLFSEGGLLFGLPLLVVYLFLTWLIVIVLAALLMERGPAPSRGDESPAATPDD